MVNKAILSMLIDFFILVNLYILVNLCRKRLIGII